MEEIGNSLAPTLECNAKTLADKFACNAPFVSVCLDILKKEWEVLKHELAEGNDDLIRPSSQVPAKL